MASVGRIHNIMAQVAVAVQNALQQSLYMWKSSGMHDSHIPIYSIAYRV